MTRPDRPAPRAAAPGRSRRLGRALGGAALALLVACARPEPAALTSLLPSPASPGESVTAYGVFPDAATVELSGDWVAATPSGPGLAFRLPEWVLAGPQEVAVVAGRERLVGTLQVRPRLDSVVLDGEQVVLRGAGWPATAIPGVAVTVEVNGVAGALASVAPGELRADLPTGLPYGPLTVRAVVAGQASEARLVTREAAAVTGQVRFPAAQPAARTTLRSARAELVAEAGTALVVFHAPGALASAPGALDAAQSAVAVPALGATRVRFATAEAANAARAALLRTPGVRAVEWDAAVTLDGAPVARVVAPAAAGAGQWHLDRLGVRDAWGATRGEGVVIAVVDTGVDLAHPDLAGRLLPGYDFIDGDATPQDLAGHGTHVAGLAAADGQALGTAPGARLLPVRVLEGEAGGSAFTVAQGVLWAADLLGQPANPYPADVINLSLGTSSYSGVLADAVAQAQAAGVLVVAATGNSGGTVAYPAALPGVVGVTALAGPSLAYQPWYANHGPGTWLTGYGGDQSQDQDGDGTRDGILSTEPGGYGLRTGTSMASPQVAGLAALALAAGAPPRLLRDTLARTATDLGVMGRDERFGYGLATARTATPAAPRTYVVAEDGAAVVGWTLVQADGRYRLDHLPGSAPLTLRALSDEDGDGLLAEAGELASAPVTASLYSGTVGIAPELLLTPADGSSSLRLAATAP